MIAGQCQACGALVSAFFLPEEHEILGADTMPVTTTRHRPQHIAGASTGTGSAQWVLSKMMDKRAPPGTLTEKDQRDSALCNPPGI